MKTTVATCGSVCGDRSRIAAERWRRRHSRAQRAYRKHQDELVVFVSIDIFSKQCNVERRRRA